MKKNPLFLIFFFVFISSHHFIFPSHCAPFLPANNVTLYGDAYFAQNSITLTQESPNCISPQSPGIGRAFYVSPIRFLDPQANATASFTCRFSFLIAPSPMCPFGDGLAFLITSRADSYSFGNGYMGLPQDSFVAVEFDTSFDPAVGDINSNHIGIDVNSVISFASVDAISKGIDLKSGRNVTAWIEYRDSVKLMRVWIGYSPRIRPLTPVLAAFLDLSSQFSEFMHVGFSASNGQGSVAHIVNHWQFKTFVSVSAATATDPVEEGDCVMCPGVNSDDRNATDHDQGRRVRIGEMALGVGGITAVILSLIAVLAFIIYFAKKRKNLMCTRNNQDQVFDGTNSSSSCRIPVRISLSEIKASTLGFHPSRIVGQGASAKVYRGTLPSGESVAIKRFDRTNQTDCSRNHFTTEFATLVGCLRHRNLVQLLGWCCERTELVLVYEYMPNGSLDRILHNISNSAVILSWDQRLDIVIGVASALLYLHEECDSQIIHRDVKTCNIMLDAEFNAKLGDFGLAEVYEHCSRNRTATIPAGTMGYLAPEYVYAGIPTQKTDVYSFGVVVLEVASGRRPVDEDRTVLIDWVWELLEKGKLIEAVDKKLAGNFNSVEMERMLMVGLSCVLPNHENRPTIKEALRMLKGEAPLPLLPAKKPAVTLRSIFPQEPEEVLQFFQEDHSPESDDAPWLTPRTHFS